MKTNAVPLIKARLRVGCLCLLFGSGALAALPGPVLEIVLPGQTTPVGLPEVVAWGDHAYGQTIIPAGLSGVVDIAAGYGHTVALKQDGTVVGWGWDSVGQIPMRKDLNTVVAIAAGDQHTVALKQDGTVVTIGGGNFSNQVPMPANLAHVVAVAAGSNFTVALKQDGTVVAWGGNNLGQTNVPRGLSGVVDIAAGYGHMVALKQDGTVAAWGYNNNGQVMVPVGLCDVVAIAASGNHSAALKQDGTVVGWGNNTSGENIVPAGLRDVVAIAAGGSHMLALKQDGTIVAWGYDYWGQIDVPSGLTGVGAIAASSHNSVALKRAIAFGIALRPAYNERKLRLTSAGSEDVSSVSATLLGADAASFSITGSPVPSSLAVGTSADLTIRFSPQHTGKHRAILRITSSDPKASPFDVALSGSGAAPSSVKLELRDATNKVISSDPSHGSKVVVWGSDNQVLDRGQLDVPKGLSGVAAVAAGAFQNTALKEDGTVVVWGDTIFEAHPAYVGLSGVVAVAEGKNHTVAVKEDGSVVAWGVPFRWPNNRWPAAVRSGVVAVSAGQEFSVALKQDGTVVAWGQNYAGQCNVPKGLSGVTAISSGEYHTMALKQDGTVVGWGSLYPTSYKNYRAPSIPTGLSGVTAVATGGDHSVALKNDGTVVTWFFDSQSTGPTPKGLNHVVAVAIGWVGAMALKDDGTVVTWNGSVTAPAGLMGVQSIACGSYHFAAVVDAPGEFGNRPLNTERDHSVRLANAGSGAGVLEVSAAIDGPDADQFSLLSQVSATISPVASTDLVYACKPTRLGPLQARLKITSNDPVTPVYTIDLSGAGIYVSNDATKPGVTGSNLILGPLVEDRSTGAILQKVTFANTSGFPLNGLRLVVSHVMPGVTVQSSSATRKVGTVEVIYSKPIAKDETVSLTLTYNDPLRRANLQPTIHAESLINPEPREGPVNGVSVPVLSVRDTPNGPLLEWNATPGKTYVVEYSDDNGNTWYSAVHRLVASSTRLLWTDRGQPETWSKPVNKAGRSYRVKRL